MKPTRRHLQVFFRTVIYVSWPFLLLAWWNQPNAAQTAAVAAAETAGCALPVAEVTDTIRAQSSMPIPAQTVGRK